MMIRLDNGDQGWKDVFELGDNFYREAGQQITDLEEPLRPPSRRSSSCSLSLRARRKSHKEKMARLGVLLSVSLCARASINF